MMPGKQQIYDALLQDIIRGEYPPEAVLNEKTLMERYGVSRAALREALVDLRNENVLRSLPRYIVGDKQSGFRIKTELSRTKYKTICLNCLTIGSDRGRSRMG